MKRTIYYLILCGLIITACVHTGCVGSNNCKLTKGVSGYGPGGWSKKR